MPGITVSEPLNPGSWTTEQQREVYDALVVLLNVPSQPTYADMTDEQLSVSLNACCAEIKSRPTAVNEPLEGTTFGDDQIITKPSE